MQKIVIVEDEEIIRRGLVCTLDWMSMGAVVVGAAGDGIEAMSVIEEKKPDVVLTDIRMPRMDGLALARQLREKYPQIRVVFLTSYAEFSYAQEAIRLQVADYLLKPVEEEALRELLLHIQTEKGKELLPSGGNVLSDMEEVLIALEKNGNPYIQAVCQEIQARYQEKLSLEQLAESQAVSVSYLSRKLKEETGHTFGSLLARYRLLRSVELLASGKWRIYEIAEQTGFGDYKNFCQVFKKYLHTSPKAFMQDTAVVIRWRDSHGKV